MSNAKSYIKDKMYHAFFGIELRGLVFINVSYCNCNMSTL